MPKEGDPGPRTAIGEWRPVIKKSAANEYRSRDPFSFDESISERVAEVLNNKKILVTGGAGFIGSNLCRAFWDQGNWVTCLDDLSIGHRSNIEDLEGKEGFRFIQGDMRDSEVVREAVKGNEIVFHQAALGSVPRSIADPLATNEVNVSGFLQVLVAARDEGVERYVFATSSSVYGDIEDLPKTEERIGSPISPYAVSKYVDELYAKVFADLYGIDVVGLRYFNVFGQGQDPEGPYAAAIPKFVKAFLKREPPIVHGDGTQMRDFTHVDNVVRANELAATVQDPDALNTVYNVACGQGTELLELLEVLKRVLADRVPDLEEVEPVHGEPRVGDVQYSTASIEKIKGKLGYEPQVGLEEGLRRTMDHYIRCYTS
ncbi:MAG: SDR family oxidoreductase [Flavobacteriales bacterium]